MTLMFKTHKKLLGFICWAWILALGATPYSWGADEAKMKKVVIMPFAILSKAGKKDAVLSWLAEGTDEEIHLKLSLLTEVRLTHSLAVRKVLEEKKIQNIWEQKDKVIAQTVARMTMEEQSDKTRAYVLMGAWDRSGETLKLKVRFLEVYYKKTPKEDWDLTTLKTLEKKGPLRDVHVWMVQTALDFLEAVEVRPSAPEEVEIRRLPTASAKAFEYVCKARLALAENNFEEALKLFKQALVEDPQYANCAYELGTIYYLMKEYSLALKSFEKAIEVRNDFQQAYRYKALSQYSLDDYDGALKSFKKAVEIKPEDAGATYNISCIYSRMGRTTEAIEWLKKAMIMEPARYRTMAQRDRDLDNIRQDPRFKELCE